MNIEILLREEIASEMKKLEGMEVGSDQYKATIEGITKMADRLIELEKNEAERVERIDSRVMDDIFKRDQLKADNRDRLIKNGLTLLTLGVTTATAIWGTIKSFEFEKEGTITTIFGRGWLNKLLHK